MLTASRTPIPDSGDELHESGDTVATLSGPGSLACVDCGFALSLAALEELPARDTLPECPACGGTTFKRMSIFDRPTMDVDAVEAVVEAPDWLATVRADVAGSGPHLAFADGGEPAVIPLAEGWTRIGRSGAADLQLDDPTVSRRHALVVHTEDGKLRALDDRSLNGLFVNGARVEWASLSDGDELEIGRYRLYVLAG